MFSGEVLLFGATASRYERKPANFDYNIHSHFILPFFSRPCRRSVLAGCLLVYGWLFYQLNCLPSVYVYTPEPVLMCGACTSAWRCCCFIVYLLSLATVFFCCWWFGQISIIKIIFTIFNGVARLFRCQLRQSAGWVSTYGDYPTVGRGVSVSLNPRHTQTEKSTQKIVLTNCIRRRVRTQCACI